MRELSGEQLTPNIRGFSWNFGLIILVSLFCMQPHVVAQLTSERVTVGAVTTQGINFYTIDANGTLQSTVQLPSEFAVEGLGQSDWIIPRTNNFAVAHNGEQIAFTAQRNNETSVFIYTIGETDLRTQLIPNISLVEWSPDDTALLLQPTAGDTSAAVYEIASSQLTPIPHSDGFAGGFQWLPDSHGILFVSTANTCLSSCTATDVYIADRDGQEAKALTNMGSETSLPYSYVCGPTWNENDRRIYYVVGCAGDGNDLSDNVYSVDLDKQTRLEVDWSTIYPDSIVQINGIHVASDGAVYLPAMVANRAGTETRWVVAKVSSQQTTIISTINFDGYKPLYRSKLSPQETYIALNGYLAELGGGDIIVFDISNGQIVAGDNATEHACDIQWVNDQELLFVQVAGWCFPAIAISNYEAVNTLSVIGGAVSNISTTLDGTVWLIEE
jgi:Tol biopolymer transport system component